MGKVRIRGKRKTVRKKSSTVTKPVAGKRIAAAPKKAPKTKPKFKAPKRKLKKRKRKVTPKARPPVVFQPDAPVTITPAPVPPVQQAPFPPAQPVDPPPVPPDPPADPNPGSGPPPTPRSFTAADAERLLWRAGFGPRAGDVERFRAMGLEGAVDALLQPRGDAVLEGPSPQTAAGAPLSPLDLWGHDHLFWLDRMVRSNQPLVERMTLIWHDWFATSREKVQMNLMLAQNELLRRHALGSFRALLREITIDPAMLDWLDGIRNTRGKPNENYAREVMELFALGANRGAYTEADVRDAARALTGWRATWDPDAQSLVDFRFVAARHDATSKSIFGQTGAFGWEDVVRLCLDHPMHASFFVTKLWSYFIPTPPDEATQAALQQAYAGGEVRPVLRLILTHRDLYEGPAMVKPPVVFAAGLLRALGRGVDHEGWSWYADATGQRLFMPPDVSGWDDDRWLSTSSWRGRWDMANLALTPTRARPWVSSSDPLYYGTTETPQEAFDRALAHVGSPHVTAENLAALRVFADDAMPAHMADWEQAPYRAMRQNALRMLILTSSDWQVS